MKAFVNTCSIRADGTKDPFAGWEVPFKYGKDQALYVLVHSRWRRVWGQRSARFIKSPPFNPMTIVIQE
jgi:hypothetical protein